MEIRTFLQETFNITGFDKLPYSEDGITVETLFKVLKKRNTEANVINSIKDLGFKDKGAVLAYLSGVANRVVKK